MTSNVTRNITSDRNCQYPFFVFFSARPWTIKISYCDGRFNPGSASGACCDRLRTRSEGARIEHARFYPFRAVAHILASIKSTCPRQLHPICHCLHIHCAFRWRGPPTCVESGIWRTEARIASSLFHGVNSRQSPKKEGRQRLVNLNRFDNAVSLPSARDPVRALGRGMGSRLHEIAAKHCTASTYAESAITWQGKPAQAHGQPQVSQDEPTVCIRCGSGEDTEALPCKQRRGPSTVTPNRFGSEGRGP